MKEKQVETYLKEQVEKRGGICWKFESPGTAGVPDRIVVLNGETVFVEVKAPGEKPRDLQRKRISQIRQARGRARWLDSKEAVDQFLSKMDLYAD